MLLRKSKFLFKEVLPTTIIVINRKYFSTLSDRKKKKLKFILKILQLFPYFIRKKKEIIFNRVIIHDKLYS